MEGIEGDPSLMHNTLNDQILAKNKVLIDTKLGMKLVTLSQTIFRLIVQKYIVSTKLDLV